MSEEEIRLENTEPVTEEVAFETKPSAPTRIKRRRHIRYAAPLGFLVLLFAVIGVVSVIVTSIGWIVAAQDDTALREELYVFLDPVMQFCPSTFDKVESASDPDSLLLAAAYRVTEGERIRQLREKDEESRYEVETTLYRMIVPEKDIAASYRALFGDAKLKHRSVGTEIEYNADKKCYYVAMSINTSGYTPVLGKISAKKDVYTVEVGYVAVADIEYDERGRALEPTMDMAKYRQTYTVEKQEKGWTLQSVSAAK